MEQGIKKITLFAVVGNVLAPSAFPSADTATVTTILSSLSLSALCVTGRGGIILPGGWLMEPF